MARLVSRTLFFMVRVKICGITNPDDACLATEFGAHALGFNFYEKSPRAVSPADAWKIRRKLAPFISAVGIFVDWKPSAVTALATSLRLDAVQLHGDECARHVDFCAKRLPVIKVLHVGPDFSERLFPRFRSAFAFLLDAAPEANEPKQFGGTGRTVDWSLACKLAASHRIILAGGLTPENVAEAIRTVCPYAVDVASGVESRPGKKDPGKLRAFFDEVARAQRNPA
ncbi:MAG: phosphoribosylanthranilate isomerase [Candidatus Acidiferrum sp.]